MKILVTGANGMLGQDLCPILEDEDYEVIETDIHNLDITNSQQVNNLMEVEKPDFVVHCAAYTNVDKAEEELEKATEINVKGTKNIAQACKDIDATLIYISTDYVFDGEKLTLYTPNDTPNPINNYGLTKFQGENVIKEICEKYYIARTSWLYGHHGKNFVETMINLKDNENLKVVDDQIGCPTWTVELCNGILELIGEEPDYGIYHICGSGKTSWFEFAKEIYSQMNFNDIIEPCKTSEFPRPATRPTFSAMDNNKFCRNWKLALKDYLNLRD